VAELEREVEILRQLDHPNIIKLHQALRTQNNLYLFTDYCDQGDLKGFMQKRGQMKRGAEGNVI